MTPLMSFWPIIYDNIISQIKLVEYRRTFPKDCTFAYMYISKPTKAICGIINFGRKFNLTDWRDEYSHIPQILSRIDEYSTRYRYGMEILSVQKIYPIHLTELRKNVTGFVAPQSYLFLENNPNLSQYIQENLKPIDNLIINDFSNAYPEHICKRH